MSIPAGDRPVGGTLTAQQLRSRYSENGGWLTPRRRRFLRRFIRPYVDDAAVAANLRAGNPPGDTVRFCFIMPLQTVREKAPAGQARQDLRAILELADLDWHLARPWLGDPDHRIPEDLLDAELGSVLERGDEYDWDNAPSEDQGP